MSEVDFHLLLPYVPTSDVSSDSRYISRRLVTGAKHPGNVTEPGNMHDEYLPHGKGHYDEYIVIYAY